MLVVHPSVSSASRSRIVGKSNARKSVTDGCSFPGALRWQLVVEGGEEQFGEANDPTFHEVRRSRSSIAAARAITRWRSSSGRSSSERSSPFRTAEARSSGDMRSISSGVITRRLSIRRLYRSPVTESRRPGSNVVLLGPRARVLSDSQSLRSTPQEYIFRADRKRYSRAVRWGLICRRSLCRRVC